MKHLKLQKIQNNLRNKFSRLGVKMVGPETIYFSKDTKIGKNVTIEPYVVFGTKVKIGNNVTIKSFSHLENCKVENKVDVGPYARIRPGTVLKDGSKVGNFVEIKKSIIGKKSKVSHLTYIGDSTIGKSVNVGAGTITCNYDGVNKHKTTIGKRSFIGSNTSLIAPINIGNDANIAAGSSISKDVDSNSLAITRAPIKFISNWSKKIKETNKEEEKCVE